MEYIKGEHIVYNGIEICCVGEWVKRNFDGVTEKEYLSLHPYGINTTIYVPKEKCDEMLRPVLSKDELIELINMMNDIDYQIHDVPPDNDADFVQAVKKGDYKTLIAFMNTIYNKGLKRADSGKSLFKTDKRKFDIAKKLIDSEIAIAFGIDISEAEDFIRRQLTNHP